MGSQKQAGLQRCFCLLLALGSARLAYGQLQLLADGANMVDATQLANASQSSAQSSGLRGPRQLIDQEPLPLVEDFLGGNVSLNYCLRWMLYALSWEKASRDLPWPRKRCKRLFGASCLQTVGGMRTRAFIA